MREDREVGSMDCIEVSPEMLSFVGSGYIIDAAWPTDPVAFVFSFGDTDKPAAFRYFDVPTDQLLNIECDSHRLIFITARAACERLSNGELLLRDGASYHLNTDLRAIAFAIRDCEAAESIRTPYRLAKSIELFCEVIQLPKSNALIPLTINGALSTADGKRVLAARQMIDEQWAEKLTLDYIARSCGLNRAKLTRGFRAMFDCTVADAISNNRLSQAGTMLLSTDLPVSSIGYRCGYLNNASFTRAFARHFGKAPTQYRAMRFAA
jgi:AraC family transcriptional regulator, transcriptional activator of the genes for pyochelin and ferripyochelin receptors